MTIVNDYLEDAVSRVLEMERAAISDTKDAVDFFFFKGNFFPYWTNRIQQVDTSLNSEQFSRQQFMVTMRLVYGHLTAGYKGQNERRQWTDITAVLNYVNARSRLQTPTKAQPPRYMGEKCSIRVLSALNAFEDTDVVQVGSEFALMMTFNVPVQR